MGKNRQEGPKVLLLDVETSPIIGYVWQLFDQNVALNQVVADWHVLSWSAKWLGAPAKETMYMDQRNAKNIENDKEILKVLWKLLDEADIVITQNGISFDIKKLNARFIINGMSPPSSFKNIDTLLIAKNKFGFTSNKLEYLTGKLCVKYKKLKHKKYSGFELWRECLAGNKEAWQEMEKYNKYDVLSLEELYSVLAPWDGTINFNLYRDDDRVVCRCGSEHFEKRGFHYTATGKYQRFRCCECGTWSRDKVNLLSKEKVKSLRPSTSRG